MIFIFQQIQVRDTETMLEFVGKAQKVHNKKHPVKGIRLSNAIFSTWKKLTSDSRKNEWIDLRFGERE